MIRRRKRSVAALVVVAAMALLLPAGSAAAVPNPFGNYCQHGPDVDDPASGLSGNLMSQPSGPVNGASRTAWERYGFAGLQWSSYDLGLSNPLGCIPDGDSLGADSADSAANMIFGMAKGTTSFAQSIVVDAFNPAWMDVFDPFVVSAVRTLQVKVFTPGSALACAVLGVLILWRARRAALSKTAELIGSGLLVMIAATVLFAYPLWAGRQVDATLTKITSVVSQSILGVGSDPSTTSATADQAMMSSIYDGLLWRTWLAGEFGNPDGLAAKKYGADLFDAQALTWEESYQAQRDPVAAERIVQGKHDKFVQVAEKIKAEDPVAYTYVQGKHAGDRAGFAGLAVLSAVLSLVTIIWGSIAMVCAFLVVLFVTVAAPALLPWAIVQRSVAVGMFDRVASVAVTALVYGIGLPIVMILNKAVYVADIRPGVRLVLIIGIWSVSFFTLRSLSPGLGGLVKRKHAKKSSRLAGRFSKQIVAALIGSKLAHVGSGGAAPTAAAADATDTTAAAAGADGPPVVHLRNVRTRAENEGDGSIYGEVIPDREPVAAPRTAALPVSPLEPDDVRLGRDAWERGLGSEGPPPKPQGPREARLADEDDVYSIYTGDEPGAQPDVPDDRALTGSGDDEGEGL